MASTEETVLYLAEQMSAAGDIRIRKMFGEYAIYCNERVVALVCDNQLFVKITDISGTYLDSSHETPAYPGARNSLLVPEERWEDREWLVDFIRDTAALVPLPKPKVKKPKK